MRVHDSQNSAGTQLFAMHSQGRLNISHDADRCSI